MLKGGVIMDVVNVEQARIAEEAGAVAVMALERIPADIRQSGSVARMSDPQMIAAIQNAVTIPVMAKALNSSPRTVNRQLAQLNTSYQHTLDEARREKALELLDGSSMSIEQISMNLGYNDPSNFGRAFRRWLGQSPRAYRKSKQ